MSSAFFHLFLKSVFLFVVVCKLLRMGLTPMEAGDSAQRPSSYGLGLPVPCGAKANSLGFPGAWTWVPILTLSLSHSSLWKRQ